jgi:hypothetical protein
MQADKKTEANGRPIAVNPLAQGVKEKNSGSGASHPKPIIERPPGPFAEFTLDHGQATGISQFQSRLLIILNSFRSWTAE